MGKIFAIAASFNIKHPRYGKEPQKLQKLSPSNVFPHKNKNLVSK